MKKDAIYLRHIRDAIARITSYAEGGRATFDADPKTQDAIIRNLEVIGEATKQLSEIVRTSAPSVPWKRIAGMRDILIHHYFGVRLDTVWAVVESELPVLRVAIDSMLDASET